MAKRPRRRIPKSRRVADSARTAVVTRAEHNRLIAVLNERNDIINALRDAVDRLERASELQFKRIAQLQADVDRIKAERTGTRS
jgi:hypothetical protein